MPMVPEWTFRFVAGLILTMAAVVVYEKWIEPLLIKLGRKTVDFFV